MKLSSSFNEYIPKSPENQGVDCCLANEIYL